MKLHKIFAKEKDPNEGSFRMVDSSFLHEGTAVVHRLRSSLGFGYISNSWRASSVTFIPNPGGSGRVNPKDIGPICLSSFILKTFELMVDR